jgi:hypothetical protein
LSIQIRYADHARIRRFQQIDAAQKGTFAGAGRPQNAHHLAVIHLQTDVLQGMEMVEVLVHLNGSDDISHRRNSLVAAALAA